MNKLNDHSLGHCTEFAWGDSRVLVFFGNGHAQLPEVSEAFPELRFASVNQTHSSLVVHAPDNSGLEADAHWAKASESPPGLALTIRTADCLPIMLFDPTTGMIAAIHAGWRGVESEIVINTCYTLKKNGAHLDQMQAWLGPHIGPSSFEVGTDVSRRLEKRFLAVRGFSTEKTSLRNHPAIDKAYVDLAVIARAQLAAQGLQTNSIHTVDVDTYRTPSHASFRRDREKAGRQLSFIAIL